MIVGIATAIETETDRIGFVGSAKLSVNGKSSVHASGNGSDRDAVVMCMVIHRTGETAAATTAAVTEGTITAKSRGAIAMDWIEVRRMLVIADSSIRIIPATIDPATRDTVTGSAEGMKSVIANIMAAADSSSTLVRTQLERTGPFTDLFAPFVY